MVNPTIPAPPVITPEYWQYIIILKRKKRNERVLTRKEKNINEEERGQLQNEDEYKQVGRMKRKGIKRRKEKRDESPTNVKSIDCQTLFSCV